MFNKTLLFFGELRNCVNPHIKHTKTIQKKNKQTNKTMKDKPTSWHQVYYRGGTYGGSKGYPDVPILVKSLENPWMLVGTLGTQNISKLVHFRLYFFVLLDCFNFV